MYLVYFLHVLTFVGILQVLPGFPIDKRLLKVQRPLAQGRSSGFGQTARTGSFKIKMLAHLSKALSYYERQGHLASVGFLVLLRKSSDHDVIGEPYRRDHPIQPKSEKGQRAVNTHTHTHTKRNTKATARTHKHANTHTHTDIF